MWSDSPVRTATISIVPSCDSSASVLTGRKLRSGGGGAGGRGSRAAEPPQAARPRQRSKTVITRRMFTRQIWERTASVSSAEGDMCWMTPAASSASHGTGQ